MLQRAAQSRALCVGLGKTAARHAAAPHSRALCVNLRKTGGDQTDSYFAKQQREQLEKLKASLAKKKSARGAQRKLESSFRAGSNSWQE